MHSQTAGDLSSSDADSEIEEIRATRAQLTYWQVLESAHDLETIERIRACSSQAFGISHL